MDMFTACHSIVLVWLIKSYMRCFCIYSAHTTSSPSHHIASSLVQTQILLQHKSVPCLAQACSGGFCRVCRAKTAFQCNK